MSKWATLLTAATLKPRRVNSGIRPSMSVVLPLFGRPTTPSTAGLQGSSGCAATPSRRHASSQSLGVFTLKNGAALEKGTVLTRTCLLYTSDAADDLLCVDLGG